MYRMTEQYKVKKSRGLRIGKEAEELGKSRRIGIGSMAEELGNGAENSKVPRERT